MATPSYIELKNDYLIIEEDDGYIGTTEVYSGDIGQGHVRSIADGVTVAAVDDWVAYKPTLPTLRVKQGANVFTILPASTILFIYSEPVVLT